jgi:DNA-directed RNA polymerase subunit alpha
MTRIPLRTLDSQAQELTARLDMSTAEIGLSVRTTNCLEERGIFTVNDLLHCTRDDLLSISNFGEKTLEEVYKALEGVGFYRRNKREPVEVRRPASMLRARSNSVSPLRGFGAQCISLARSASEGKLALVLASASG